MNQDDKQPTPETLRDEDLDQAAGGLLLPAVQKVREAAARISVATVTPQCDGSV